MTDIKVGDLVRIKDSYSTFIRGGDVHSNKPGTVFTVTEVVEERFAEGGNFYVGGDPNGWNVWGSQVEKVEKPHRSNVFLGSFLGTIATLIDTGNSDLLNEGHVEVILEAAKRLYHGESLGAKSERNGW